jgi:hypothetical protein
LNAGVKGKLDDHIPEIAVIERPVCVTSQKVFYNVGLLSALPNRNSLVLTALHEYVQKNNGTLVPAFQSGSSLLYGRRSQAFLQATQIDTNFQIQT